MKTTPQFQVDYMKRTMFANQGHWERKKINGRRLYGMRARVKKPGVPGRLNEVNEEFTAIFSRNTKCHLPSIYSISHVKLKIN